MIVATPFSSKVPELSEPLWSNDTLPVGIGSPSLTLIVTVTGITVLTVLVGASGEMVMLEMSRLYISKV